MLRIAFISIVLAHGLIHVLGFAKAFGLAELPQLAQHISRPLGVVWLAAGALCVVAAIALAAGARSWWWIGIAAALVSQAVVISSWGDAKFGTLANVLLLLVAGLAALGRAPWSYAAAYEREVVARTASATLQPVVTEADLERLPPPVARYLRVAGAVGRPRTTSFGARFRGAIRSGPTAAWMPFEVEQRSFFDPPARLFLMRAARAGVPFDVLHLYREGAATMQVRVASLVRVVDGKGPLLDRSETVTFLNDACLLAPGALTHPAFRWEPIDERHARVRLRVAANEVAAELSFDDAGHLVDFVSEDRTRSDDGVTGERLRWSTPVSDFRAFEGRTVGAHGEALWHAPDGPYVYGKFDLVELVHDVGGRTPDAAAEPGASRAASVSAALRGA